MSTACNCNLSHNNKDIWVISEGRISDIDLSGVIGEKVDGPYKEYKISDIGRYLLNPHSIEVKKKLIGGEIHYMQGIIKKIRKSIHKTLPAFLKKRKQNPSLSPEVIVSRYKMRIPSMKDSELEVHLNKIYDQLKSYDSFSKKLDLLDPPNIFQIVGICEDIGGNYSYLKLQGSIEEKIKYLGKSIAKDVGVILNKAYVAEGLYELRGFDFQSYNPAVSYRLFSYNNGKEHKACVLTSLNQVEFYITDNHLLKHMFLLEQSLKANPSLCKVFELCTGGEANPIKLFFNKKLEIDYAKSPLPAIYQDVLKTHNTGSNSRNLIKPILNYLQIGISLNYMLADDDKDDRTFTHISVLHDLRALEPLRKNLPDVYAAVAKHGFITDSGRFYLLDSINGYNNA
ncbi:hypothetical protein D1BOALGB6SA_8874 [Olavius sp. associated proteobacterium Delta 1]|nr:hypothetical protein D1BOALGB6SA_8874 [Olavius sp. associated proteobacterium Delta 1]